MTGDWEKLRLKVKYLYREWLFRNMVDTTPATDSKLVAECARYEMDVVWHEGLGMYLVGKDGQYYGVIGADGIDMPTVIAELFVTGTFGVDP